MPTASNQGKKKKRKGSGMRGVVLSILGLFLCLGLGVGLMAYTDQLPYSADTVIYSKIAIGLIILSVVFMILFIVNISIYSSRKEKNDGIKRWLKKGIEVEGTVHEVQPVAKMNFDGATTTDPVKLVGTYQTEQGQIFPFILQINVLPGEILPTNVTVFYDASNPGFYMVEYTNQRKEIYRNTGIPSMPATQPPLA